MDRTVIDLHAITPADLPRVGGKAAGLAALARVDGARVPPGFVVTTDALRDAGAPDAPLPDDLALAITAALARLGYDAPVAVRSSATAEDLPTASFAGLHDSFLGVVGPAAVLDAVRRVRASLYSDRARAYRDRHLIPDDAVAMAVVVQRMVPARAAGVLFTADPVSGDRTITAIEAVRGLGDALVSGLVTPDRVTVGADAVLSRHDAGPSPVLTDAEALALAALGRRVAAALGRPQDIEWCLADDGLHLVQSRPITTLFPVPTPPDDTRRVYISVGHQQMMTDAMRPFGLSFFQLTGARPFIAAGSHLFVDVTPILAAPTSRAGFLALSRRSDPLVADALETLLARGDVIPDDAPPAEAPQPISILRPMPPLDADPAIVAGLVARNEASVAALARAIDEPTGPALFDFILDDLKELKRLLVEPPNTQAIMASMNATWWLNEHVANWLGDENVATTLAQSVPGNVTSEMGLALLDVADAIRPHPEVVAFLARAGDDDGFLAALGEIRTEPGAASWSQVATRGGSVPEVRDQRAEPPETTRASLATGEFPRALLDALRGLPGGDGARAALLAWLERFGHRAVAEIDITRPRFAERPSRLLPLLLSHVARFAPGEATRRFEAGRAEALAAERALLERLAALPDGAEKVAETKRQIDLLRTFAGYREYPKFGIIRRYAHYKRALRAEIARLVAAGVLADPDDAWFLTFGELHDAARAGAPVDPALIRDRRAAFREHAALVPPRVMTSDGEVVRGRYRRDDAPPGALLGVGVSAGVAVGRVRVVLDVADAALGPDDVLVTRFTDPSWTPLFLGVAALVTEVGGLMSHGAVVAREYGLPAVVGVERATERLRDGQRVRVDGTAGLVELLPDDAPPQPARP